TTLLLFLFSLLLRAASFTLFPYTTLFRSSRLFERAVVHARNEGVAQLFIHALSENTAMLRIARNAWAVLERAGSETEAHLRLPPADFDSRISEMISEHVTNTDYHLKAQARQFWSVIRLLQEIRQGVRDARDRTRG